MSTVRPAAVAGMFYPDNPALLNRQLDGFLAAPGAPAVVVGNAPPRALIVPHAGYIYSGAVAAEAYRRLAPFAGRYRRVVLLGPSHRVAFRGLALSGAERFQTPLGDIPVDRESSQKLMQLPGVGVLNEAHALEHSLEVQLPFLQRTLKDFLLVPIVVGDADADRVAPVIEHFWNDDSTLIVISTDLSHYLDYDTALEVDQATCDAIEQLAGDKLGYEQACGRNPLRGLLTVARNHQASIETLAMASSGDTAGDRSRVVGYGAWIVQ